MTLRYDPEADAVYIKLADGAYDESEEVAPGIVLDYDAEDRVVGIEVLGASKALAPGGWSKARLPGPRAVEAAE